MPQTLLPPKAKKNIMAKENTEKAEEKAKAVGSEKEKGSEKVENPISIMTNMMTTMMATGIMAPAVPANEQLKLLHRLK